MCGDELNSDFQAIAIRNPEIAPDIGEISIYSRCTAARSQEMAANSRIWDHNHQ